MGILSGLRGLGKASQVLLVVKNPPANAGDVRDVGFIPGLGRSPGGDHGNPLQYSCLENPIDRGAWWTTVHRVAKSQTQLSTHALLFLSQAILNDQLGDPCMFLLEITPVLLSKPSSPGRWIFYAMECRKCNPHRNPTFKSVIGCKVIKELLLEFCFFFFFRLPLVI